MFDDKIEYIPGENPILLIAPHGHPKNDTNTGELTRILAEKLKCHAVINEHYRRPYEDEVTGENYTTNKEAGIVNLNHIREFRKVGMEDIFLKPIINVKDQILSGDNIEEVFVVHIHGIGDRHYKKKDNDKPPMLVGMGHPDRFSCTMQTAEDLIKYVGEQGSHPISARIEKGGGYAAWANHNLNQLFTGVVKPYRKDNRVQSFQLEIKETGYRDKKNIGNTAETLGVALRKIAGLKEAYDDIVLQVEAPEETQTKAMVPTATNEVDTELVDTAFTQLKDIFIKHYEEARGKAMLEAGRYIVETFYNDDFKLAKEKKSPKQKSLNQLIKRLQGQSGNAPSKTWFYDAVGLAIDANDLKSFQTYGKLTVSHKLALLPVKDTGEKKKLIADIVEKTMSVRDLKRSIKECVAPQVKLSSLIRNPAKLFSGKYEKFLSTDYISSLGEKERKMIKERITEEKTNLEMFLNKMDQLKNKL